MHDMKFFDRNNAIQRFLHSWQDTEPVPRTDSLKMKSLHGHHMLQNSFQ